ncbi:MAG: hypothetical protein [Podoviridae sp. ctQNx1]|nr:MAG: hypothetical protein [Podoviridae sp. ctQNx1]
MMEALRAVQYDRSQRGFHPKGSPDRTTGV